MPWVNLGGTAKRTPTPTPHKDHSSNYTEFLRQGGRGIDTALTYSDPLNRKIAQALRDHPEIPRAEIFLTTKVPCCPGTPEFCENGEYNGTIARDMARNNALLGVAYTDITLLHHPCATAAQTLARYRELQGAMAAGHTKAVARQRFAEHFHTFRVGAPTLTDPQLRRSDLSAFVLESRAHSLSETSAIF